MIKNASIYRVKFDPQVVPDFKSMAFLPTAPAQQKSVGWVPPNEACEGFVARISGASVVKLVVETRAVPAKTVADEVAKRVKLIEEQTGRKPGKKEKQSLKEEVLFDLLPKAFPKQRPVLCIIDNDMLILDTTSSALSDDAITALVKSIHGIEVQAVITQENPSAVMAKWLIEGDANGFGIGKSCELKATDESAAKVRYTNHFLLTEEVQAHLMQGKRPTSLALEFDERVGFVLTEDMHIKALEFGDNVMQQARQHDINPGDFEGSMAIAIGEFRPLLAELIAALGGYATPVDGGVSVNVRFAK